MGNNSSSCSKNIENTCEVNRVDCECPNGVAYPGKCNINDKIRCRKCLPNFGANEESNIYFDRKGTLLKTLTQHEFKKYLGAYWRPSRMEMVNHQTGKSTTLLWENWKFSKGLTDSDFNKASLKRSR